MPRHEFILAPEAARRIGEIIRQTMIKKNRLLVYFKETGIKMKYIVPRSPEMEKSIALYGGQAYLPPSEFEATEVAIRFPDGSIVTTLADVETFLESYSLEYIFTGRDDEIMSMPPIIDLVGQAKQKDVYNFIYATCNAKNINTLNECVRKYIAYMIDHPDEFPDKQSILSQITSNPELLKLIKR